jgi:hypothetical protein
MLWRIVLAIAVTAGCYLATDVSAKAEGLPTPHEKPILEIKGKITITNTPEHTAIFDREMLEQMGITKIQTSTPWTDGTPVFEGVLMRDLLKRVGAHGENIVATALNDYKVTLPISDFDAYPIILAYKMNGQVLKVRDKGPLWIIYPQDEYSELRDKSVHQKWIWQIKEFEVE